MLCTIAKSVSKSIKLPKMVLVVLLVWAVFIFYFTPFLQVVASSHDIYIFAIFEFEYLQN